MGSAGTCCHWLAGGSDLARVLHRRQALLVWSDVSLAPVSFASRLQAATFRAVVDSALQSVHRCSTTGCGRVRRALRSPAAGLLYLPACYDVTLGSSFQLGSHIVVKRQYPE
jgi:hypothetical protein